MQIEGTTPTTQTKNPKMKNPNYAAEIVSTMRSQDRPAWQIVGYLEGLLAGLQRAAEDHQLTSALALDDLANSAAFIKSNPK